MLIVLKKTWMHNVNTAFGEGGEGGEMRHFDVGLIERFLHVLTHQLTVRLRLFVK